MTANNRTSKLGDDETEFESLPRHDGKETTIGTVTEMLENYKKTSTRAASILVLAVFIATERAVAAHDSLPCEVPPSLVPLFELLDTLAQVTFLGGVGLATLGFVVAGVYIVVPGEEYNRRGKDVAKHVLLGTILLLSANMIVAFLVSQFGVTICT